MTVAVVRFTDGGRRPDGHSFEYEERYRFPVDRAPRRRANWLGRIVDAIGAAIGARRPGKKVGLTIGDQK